MLKIFVYLNLWILFSGGTNDILLYVAIPLCGVGLLIFLVICIVCIRKRKAKQKVNFFILNSAFWDYFYFFSKIKVFKILFQEYHHSVKQF